MASFERPDNPANLYGQRWPELYSQLHASVRQREKKKAEEAAEFLLSHFVTIDESGHKTLCDEQEIYDFMRSQNSPQLSADFTINALRNLPTEDEDYAQQGIHLSNPATYQMISLHVLAGLSRLGKASTLFYKAVSGEAATNTELNERLLCNAVSHTEVPHEGSLIEAAVDQVRHTEGFTSQGFASVVSIAEQILPEKDRHRLWSYIGNTPLADTLEYCVEAFKALGSDPFAAHILEHKLTGQKRGKVIQPSIAMPE